MSLDKVYVLGRRACVFVMIGGILNFCVCICVCVCVCVNCYQTPYMTDLFKNINEKPQMLLWAGSLAAHVKFMIISIPNHINDCVISYSI